MLRGMMLAAGLAAMMAGTAHADGIVGDWRTDSGETAQIAATGNAFAITLRTGKHKGKRIGQMSAIGNGKYKGTITDPADDKTYSGNATVKGNSLAMQGCVAVIFCKTQNWRRQ